MWPLCLAFVTQGVVLRFVLSQTFIVFGNFHSIVILWVLRICLLIVSVGSWLKLRQHGYAKNVLFNMSYISQQRCVRVIICVNKSVTL